MNQTIGGASALSHMINPARDPTQQREEHRPTTVEVISSGATESEEPPVESLKMKSVSHRSKQSVLPGAE